MGWPECFRNRRLVHRIPDYQFLQPREFRAQIRRPQSRAGESNHQHNLSLLAPFEIHRQLRSRDARSRSSFQYGMGRLRTAIRSNIEREATSYEDERKSSVRDVCVALGRHRVDGLISEGLFPPFAWPGSEDFSSRLRPRHADQEQPWIAPEQANSEPLEIALGPPHVFLWCTVDRHPFAGVHRDYPLRWPAIDSITVLRWPGYVSCSRRTRL